MASVAAMRSASALYRLFPCFCTGWRPASRCRVAILDGCFGCGGRGVGGARHQRKLVRSTQFRTRIDTQLRGRHAAGQCEHEVAVQVSRSAWRTVSSFSWGTSTVAGNVCFVGGVTPIRRSGAVQLGAIPCGSLASEPVLLVWPRDYEESSARRDHQASAAVVALSASWMPSPTRPAVAAQCRGMRARAPGSHRCSSRVSGAGAVLS